MKFSILFLFCVLVAVISVTQSQTLIKFFITISDCKRKTGATEDIKKCLMEMTLPKEWKSYYAIACVCKRLDIMNADNTVNEKGARKALQKFGLSSYKAAQITKICKKDVGKETDEAKAAQLLMICIHKHTN